MKLKKLNWIYLSIVIPFLTAIIISNKPLPSSIEIIIRDVSFYLTIAFAMLFVFLSIYFDIRKKESMSKKVVLISLLKFLFLGLFVFSFSFFQIQSVKENELIPYGCSYFDSKGNLIYKNHMEYACEKPTIVSQDEFETVLLFNEDVQSKVRSFVFDFEVYREEDNTIESKINIKTEIRLLYDEEGRLVFYQADVKGSNILFHNNQYYHIYNYEQFRMEQVFEVSGLLSTQIHSSAPFQFILNYEPEVLVFDFDVDALVEKQRIVYDLSFSVLSNNNIDITLEQSKEYHQSGEKYYSYFSGSGIYQEMGYTIDLTVEDSELLAKRNIKVERVNNDVNITRSIDTVAKKESSYHFHNPI
ncbi:MAG: hypothetical protein Q7I99_04320, partial [Acholeplasmataceae bacterium]|nr:hypothetical protein [Acholeplasmataceae bacterium]